MNVQPHPQMLELEAIERNAWQDFALAMPQDLVEETGLRTQDLNSAFLFLAANVPEFQFNWLSGAGLNGDDGRSIPQAVQRFREVNQRTFLIHLPPGPNFGHCEMLARAEGLRENPLAYAKFYRTTVDLPSLHFSLRTRSIGVEERDVFGATATEGFGMQASMARWFAQLVGRDNWHTYVSFAGDEPVGAAAMYVRGTYAWLGIGATRPEMRRRGSQSALLVRRLSDAARVGAKHATVETGVPRPGEAATSYANIRRAGFSVAYQRPNWGEP